MKKICFISCVKKKKNEISKAKDLYNSTLFKLSLKYASKNFDEVYILSAEHYLIELDDIIKPYDKTLIKMKKQEVINWSKIVENQIRKRFNIKDCKFYVIAGKKYYQYLNLDINPLFVLPIGKKMQILKRELEKNAN